MQDRVHREDVRETNPELRLWLALGLHASQVPDLDGESDEELAQAARWSARLARSDAAALFESYGPQLAGHFTAVASYRGVKHGVLRAEAPYGLEVAPAQEGVTQPLPEEVDWRQPRYGREGIYCGPPNPTLNPALWPEDIMDRNELVLRLVGLRRSGACGDECELEWLRAQWELHELQRANVLHYKWVLMVLYFMCRLRVTTDELAEWVGRHEDTVKVMLLGVSYGKPSTRVEVSWQLIRELVERGHPLPWVVARVNQWGDWAPPDVLDPVFRLDGRVPLLG